MAATTNIIFTLGFKDETSRDVTVGPFRPTDVNTAMIKARTMMYNDEFTSDTATLAVSRYGAEYTGITRARSVTKTTTVVF